MVLQSIVLHFHHITTMTHIENLPAELLLHILSYFRNTKFLALIYSHVPHIRALVHANPNTLFSDTYILNKKPVDTLLRHLVTTPQSRFTVLLDRMLINVKDSQFPHTYQALLAAIPSVTNFSMTLRIAQHQNGILRCAAQHGWSHLIVPLCSHFNVSPTEYTLIAATVQGNLETVAKIVDEHKHEEDLKYTTAVFSALEHNHTDIAALLLGSQNVDLVAILQHAIAYGRAAIVHLLLTTHNTTCANTDMGTAIIGGHTDVAAILLNTGNINLTVGQHALCMDAMDRNRPAIIQLFLNTKQINPAFGNDTILLWATRNGHTNIVQMLLADDRVDPATSDNTPLKNAAENGYTDIVELLLNTDEVDPRSPLNEPLRRAAQYGHAPVVDLLLARKEVDPTYFNNNPFLAAIKNNRAAVVALFLKQKGVDPACNFNLPICEAAMSGYTDIVALLIATKKIDVANDNNSPLRYAAQQGHYDVVVLLLATGIVDPACKKNEPIISAATRGHTKIVDHLLSFKSVHPAANTFTAVKPAANAVNPAANDNEPLYMAVRNNHAPVVKSLLATGAVDPAARRNTLIEIATERGYTEVVALLLATGKVVPNHTLLRSAVLYNHDAIVKLFLDTKLVDPTVEYYNLFSHATQKGNLCILKHLLSAVQDPIPPYIRDRCYLTAMHSLNPHIIEFLLSTTQTTTFDTGLLLFAAKHGYPNIAAFFTTRPSTFQFIPEVLKEALDTSIAAGHAAVVKLLLTLPNIDDALRGKDHLCRAIIHGRSGIVQQLLLKNNAVDPAQQDNKPLKLALIYTEFAAIRLLLKTHNVNPTFDNNTLWYTVVREGHEDLVNILITAYNVDPSINNDIALRTAALHGYPDIVALLLATGRVNPAVHNYEPLCKAVKCGHIAVTKLLLNTAIVNSSAVYNNKLLCTAAQYGHTAIARLLLDKYPFLHKQEPLRLAIAFKAHSAVVKLLRSTIQQDLTTPPSTHTNTLT